MGRLLERTLSPLSLSSLELDEYDSVLTSQDEDTLVRGRLNDTSLRLGPTEIILIWAPSNIWTRMSRGRAGTSERIQCESVLPGARVQMDLHRKQDFCL